MRFREAIQVRLQEKYRRLYKSNLQSFDANVRYFLEWADATPALSSLLGAIERSEPELDPAEWWTGPRRGRNVTWPDTEVGRAKVMLWVLRRIAAGDEEGYQVAIQISQHTNVGDALRELCNDAVEPVIEYVQERLGAESDMLYLLERYRRWVVWFEQERLWREYLADTRHGEMIYDRHLRRFLFDQGIDYPLSQPVSPSGKVDVLADVDRDEPLSCEVKLFDDGERYGISYLAKGFQQALRYAEDYGHPAGHLVVFNLSDRAIELPSDDAEAGWPPRLDVADVTIFMVVVQAKPRPSASQSGGATPVVVRRDQLVKAGA